MSDHLPGQYSVTTNLQGKPDAGDRREERLKQLAQFCLGIIPTKVVGEPDWQDGRSLVDDLCLFAAKVDQVVAAYGDYVNSVIGISKEDQKLFASPLADALEGNALYVIESEIEIRQEGLDEQAAADAYEFRRGI